MNRKISVGMTVTIVILAMTVTFSITMLMAMRLFDHTVTSVKEKESMYNKVAEVDRYVRANDYYDIDETMLYDRLTAGYLLGTGDKYARYYTASAYTDLLNEIIRCPDRVRLPASQQAAAACGKTREALNSELEGQPIDEDNARALLLQLAAEQYDAIGNTEYETVRLRRLLTGRKPMPELDAELLQSAVSKVRVTNNCVTVTLKNGQTIERRDQL